MNPYNEPIYEKNSVNIGLFHIHITEPGIYTFIINNSRVIIINYLLLFKMQFLVTLVTWNIFYFQSKFF